MLLLLLSWFQQLESAYDYLNNAILLRAVMASVTAFLLHLLCARPFIAWLTKYQISQTIRTEGPKTHLAKKNTPTMGGLLLIAAIFLATILWAKLSEPYIWILLIAMGAFAFIGFLDDYLKIICKNTKGL